VDDEAISSNEVPPFSKGGQGGFERSKWTPPIKIPPGPPFSKGGGERLHKEQHIMTTVTLEIPDELIRNFSSLEDVCRVLYEDFIIEMRQRGIISLSRAAELLGLSYHELFALLGKKGLSFMNASPQEITDSYRQFESWMDGHRGG
jgi:predicted HTH domain antitoxin